MDERILINPDNRFLASSGASDLSVYGAPSDPALTFRRAEPEGGGAEPDTPPGSAGRTGGAEALSKDIQQSGIAASDAAGPAWGSTAVAARLPEAAPSSSAQADAAGAPSSPSPLAPATFDISAPVAPVAPAAAAAATAPVTGEPVSAPPLQVQQLSPAEQAEPLAAAVTGPLASLSIDEAVGSAADDVQDLLGSDPAAGIATLVSLVSISDVVDLGDAGAGAADVVVSPVYSMLDALAADPLGALAPDPDEADDAAAAAGTLLGGAPLGGDPADLPFGLG